MEESGTKLHIPLVLKHFVLFPQKLSVCGRVFVYLFKSHQLQDSIDCKISNSVTLISNWYTKVMEYLK